MEAIEAAIVADGYDTGAWHALWSEAQRLSIAESRDYYERFLRVFPTAAKYWRLYVQHELKNKNFAQVQALLNRSLITCVSVPLYHDYLRFMAEQKRGSATFRTEMTEAYKFVLDQVGLSFRSTELWQEYIGFVKDSPAGSFHEENQKILDVRKAYQSATKSPKQNVEVLWRGYTDYENSVKPELAKKIIGEFSKTYNKARQTTRALEHKLKLLNDALLARPPRGDPVDKEQLRRWLDYIDWEKSNPMGYEGKEAGNLVKRVHYAYRQCLVVLRHYERIWIDVATYLSEAASEAQQRGDSNAAIQLESDVIETYKEATKFLPHSVILGLAHADHLESHGKNTEAQVVYVQMLKRLDEVGGEDLTLVYIQYMRSMRRTGGEKALREVFKLARMDDKCSHHVFVAAALMELATVKSGGVVCNKVFQYGLRKEAIAKEPAYALAYLNHLSHLTDQENTRHAFQQLLADIPTAEAEEVWRAFHNFECSYGTLQAVVDVEKKLTSLYPEKHEKQPAKHLIGRFKFMDLMPVTTAALDTMGMEPAPAPGSARLGAVGPAAAAQAGAAPSAAAAAAASAKPRFYGPDLRMLGPFKPNRESRPGVVYRPMVLELLSRLPPPDQFRAEAGLVVNVNKLLKEIATREIPEPSSSISIDGPEAAERPPKRSLDDPSAPTAGAAQRIKLE